MGKTAEGARRARAAAVRVDLVEQRAQQARREQHAAAAQRRAQAAVARAAGADEVRELLAVDRAVFVGIEHVEHRSHEPAALVAARIGVLSLAIVGVLAIAAALLGFLRDGARDARRAREQQPAQPPRLGRVRGRPREPPRARALGVGHGALGGDPRAPGGTTTHTQRSLAMESGHTPRRCPG